MKSKTTLSLLILFALGSFALHQRAQAVVPPPDGGYPGGNTAEGQSALFGLTTGGYNTAVGLFALRANTTGSFNTGLGAGALAVNHGDENTATGAGALLGNVTAAGNTADGAFALFSNTTGSGNTATGLQALFSNIDGIRNTATGVYALNHNDHGGGNTAIGYQALATSTASSNTAIGNDALVADTMGENNTAIGAGALVNNTIGGFNTALGAGALSNSNGFGNIGVGALAGGNIMAASNVICIGANTSVADVSNTTWINNIYGIATISGTTVPVIVSDAGQLGTNSSSRRFKKDIEPMDKASEAILALKPVSFHYKTDPKSTAQFGLIAEEVAEVNPDLIVRDKNGKPYSVRYDQVNAMLLNEFLKEHRKVEEQQGTIGQLKSNAAKQEATINELRKDMGVLTARVKQQAAQLRKVSAQIELSKPVLRMAVNKP